MLYHNLKLALRNLWRNKTFSFINIMGFTLGLASCIIIGLYVFNELSFDRFHEGHARIYRVNKAVREKGKDLQIDAITSGLLAPALVKNIPEIKSAARFRPWFNDMVVSYDTISLKIPDVVYADQGFLDIFSFPMLSGERQKALTEPFTAVITRSTARRLFGDANPLGKVVKTLNNIPVTITGVVGDTPSNSSLQFTLLISWVTTTVPAQAGYFSWMNNWITQVDYTFVRLGSGSDPLVAGKKITALLSSNLPEKKDQFTAYLQGLDDLHLGSSGIFYAEQFRTNSGKLIYTLLLIAGIILLIACFNFINLTTAAALNRARETGVAKVLGAKPFQLVVKFFTESFLVCSFSVLAAVLVVTIAVPYFNILAGAGISAELLTSPPYIAGLLGLLLFVSVCAGLYPAIFLSGFRSTDVFRNVIKAGKNTWLRKSLVTVQFTLSILLIIATLVVQKQMRYISTKDLGFDKDQVVVVQLANTGLEKKAKAFTAALQAGPGIGETSLTNRVPGQVFNGYDIVPEGSSPQDHLMASVLESDADFASVYNIHVLKGRYFSPQLPTDTTEAIVINEAMCRYLNWNDPIGKKFEVKGERKGRVIGVIRDINTTTLRENVQPLAIILKSNPLYLSVKLKGNASSRSLEFLSKTWKQFAPEYPFDFFYMDDKMNEFYKSDKRLLNVLTIFAGLAIMIAGLGLFGLSIYSAKQRTKEIGIRKVMGASVTDITALLSKDFLKLVLIAAVIAFPAGSWVMHRWIEDFAYRTTINWVVFMLAGLIALAIALVTVCHQAIKAAMANPVQSLRTE